MHGAGLKSVEVWKYYKRRIGVMSAQLYFWNGKYDPDLVLRKRAPAGIGGEKQILALFLFC